MSYASAVTGQDLKIARLIYGYETQEKFADAAGVTVATIQRYESSIIVDAKILGWYEHDQNFDMESIIIFIGRLRPIRRRELERLPEKQILQLSDNL